MKNDLLTIGPVTIHGYGLMIGIGVIAAYLTAEYRAKKLKLDPDQVFSLVIWCLIFGGLGSKLLFCLSLKLRILYFYTDNRSQPFPDILAGKVRLTVF